jgi:protein transport protein SEC20
MTSTAPQLASLQRRLGDLNSYQLPRLRECTGPIGLHNELADELRLDLAGIRRGLEVAKEEVELIQGYEDREGGWRVYEAVEGDYKRYVSSTLFSPIRIGS